MNKRGISPLIATVILIAFAIVLGSLIIGWGTDIFEESTQDVSEKVLYGELGVGTSLDLSMGKIKASPCIGGLEILIKSNSNVQVDGFIVRIVSDQEIEVFEIDEVLLPFNSKFFNVDYQGYVNDITEIEVIPKVRIDGELFVLSDVSIIKIIEEGDILIESEGDENTILYMDFNEGEGTFVCDSSGNGNHGTLGDGICLPGTEPCPEWVTYLDGYALDFDDLEIYTNISNNNRFNELSDEMTIELSLVYEVSGPVRKALLDKRDIINYEGFYFERGKRTVGDMEYCWVLELGNGNEFRSFYCIPDQGSSYFENEKLYNLAIIYDSNLLEDNIKIYDQDGLVCSSGTYFTDFGSIIIPEEELILGLKRDYHTYRFNGLINELIISNIARDFTPEGSCNDIDGDSYDDCNIGKVGDDGKVIDCDDNDPNRSPGLTEICDNLIDDDCDYLPDCNDPNCYSNPVCMPVGDFYVDKDGYYYGSCSDEIGYGTSWTTPWCTIEYATQYMDAGSTLLVADGDYNEEGYNGYGIGRYIPSGTEGNPTIIKAAGDNVNIINDRVGESYGFFLSGTKNYITLDGFNINTASSCVGYCIYVQDYDATGIIIKNNKCYGIDGTAGGRIQLRNPSGLEQGNNIIENNYIENGGIFLDGGTYNLVIKDNFIIMGDGDQGIGVGVQTAYIQDVLVTNNTIVDPFSWGSHAMYFKDCKNCEASYNKFYNTHDVIILFAHSGFSSENIVIDHNTVVSSRDASFNIDSFSAAPFYNTIIKNNLVVNAARNFYSDELYPSSTPIEELYTDYNYYIPSGELIRHYLCPSEICYTIEEWRFATDGHPIYLGGLGDNSEDGSVAGFENLFKYPDFATSYDFTPKLGSWVCGKADDGTDIGALPCA